MDRGPSPTEPSLERRTLIKIVAVLVCFGRRGIHTYPKLLALNGFVI